MAFVVDAVGETDFVLPGQFQVRNQVGQKIGSSFDGRGHVKGFAFFYTMERAGRHVPGIVPAGAVAVDTGIKTFLIQGQYGLFIQVMQLQGFPGSEVDQLDLVLADHSGQKLHMICVDGAGREPQPQHAGFGASFSVGTELTAGAFILGRRQFLGIESPCGFLEYRELFPDIFFCCFCNVCHECPNTFFLYSNPYHTILQILKQLVFIG